MAHADGTKSGGRRSGTPNKATAHTKAFLERVFTRAFDEKTPETLKSGEVVQLGLEDRLVASMVNMTIDAKLFHELLVLYSGRAAQQVDHDHRGTISLEQLIAGTLPTTEDPT